jgi:hypothetical protein
VLIHYAIINYTLYERIAGFKRAADSQNMGAYSSVTSLNGSGSSHANPSIIINRLLAKTAIPVINKLLQSSDSVKSLELKGQLRQLAQFCRSQMGPGAFEGSFANKQTADKVCSMLSLG